VLGLARMSGGVSAERHSAAPPYDPEHLEPGTRPDGQNLRSS
jgi:hypothetical protein